MRGDWIKTNTVVTVDDESGGGVLSPVEDVLGTYNAKSLVGEMV